jgi:hypothetical protein
MSFLQAISSLAACGLVLSVVAAPALPAEPASANVRQRTARVVAGERIRLGNYIHFKASTCKAMTIPKVIVRKQPAKGTLSVTKDLAVLRKASSERAKACIGKEMRAAIVEYKSLETATGEEQLVYDVIYPDSCRRCRNRQVQVTISVSPPAESPQAVPRSPDALDSEETN